MKKEESEDGWWRFCALCLNAKSVQQIDEILTCFLTHDEREMVAARTEIVTTLFRGEKTQREIAEDLGLSISQITRGSNQIKTLRPPFRKFLEEHLL